MDSPLAEIPFILMLQKWCKYEIRISSYADHPNAALQPKPVDKPTTHRATQSDAIPAEQSSIRNDPEPDRKGCPQGAWGQSGVWPLSLFYRRALGLPLLGCRGPPGRGRSIVLDALLPASLTAQRGARRACALAS